MENIITNHTQTSTLGSTAQATAWSKFKHGFNQFLNAIYIIRCVCCFTSICSLIGTIILITGGNMSLAGVMYVIGIPSALLACPFKFIKIALSLIVGGFTIGLCFLGVGCIIGAGIGFIIAVLLVLYFPAFVTIPHFFKELRY